MKNTKNILLFLFFIHCISIFGQQVAVLKYKGGGDWYANPTALPNLIRFCNSNSNTAIDSKIETATLEDDTIQNYPIIFITGHGNIFFSEQEAINLKNYLISGGFLHISDNYGLNPYIRKAMKKVFPSLDFKEIPNKHPIYHQNFSFDNGLPKIHEHDAKPAQGFGLFHKGRLVVFYDYQSDLSDGWEDEVIHHDPEEIRLKALKMGANIITYAFTH
ncbi:DUF4159 domain-containing protein [Tenacibaculum piscium]|uniref:DUF4159 domain-containing protein n=1 Tax=Tenacibaculum piscium TaxID=1458515 RepID=UPI001EFC18DD|nr:DUF4159 domain-containing protein [Tenacibaculum piscium]MCG8183674.1 DUF4159 domain-containing protein [Tenacibaculum piscium]MCG8204839.1 DUF4159 domain-containing protein [Tenacibaculum piscium]